MQSLRTLVRHPQFIAGVRDMSGISLGLAAWGLVTGVAMIQTGLSVPLALFMTFAVFAGSAQLSVLPLMAVGAPVWVLWATAVCVNLRFVVFSALWRPYFIRLPRWQRVTLGYFGVDLTFVLFMKRFPEPRPVGAEQLAYFAGTNGMNWVAWQLASVAGIVLADAVPTHWGLGFAGVLALLGLTYSMLTDKATSLAALVAGAAAVAAFALPLKLNILVAIAAAVCVGLLFDGADDARRRAAQEVAS